MFITQIAKEWQMKKGDLVVGLDVGTTTICVVVGEVHPEYSNGNGLNAPRNRIEIIGIGSSPSKGLRKGIVVHIENTVESIKRAVKEAEAMAGVEIRAVTVGITGGEINSFQSHGILAVKEQEIGQREISRVIDAARAVAIPLDREVLHVVPVGFILDGQDGINDPTGMSGVRLEANVRIITGTVTSVQNLIKSCQRAGLDVLDIVIEPLASAEAVLSGEEKDLGAGVVDIGGGTTDIALFYGGHICHTLVLALGGNNLTNDVAIGLRVTASEAERIKKNYGCSLMSMVKQDEEIPVMYPGARPGKKIPRQHLIEILQPRAEEIFSLVKDAIVKSGSYGLMTSGVVLTGGAALMRGMDVMAENILELPVRVGKPTGIEGITDIVQSPMYAAGVGLVLYGSREIMAEQKLNNGNILNGAATRMKKWVKGVFK